MDLYEDSPPDSPYRMLPIALGIVLFLACGLGGFVFLAIQSEPSPPARAVRNTDPDIDALRRMQRQIERDTAIWSFSWLGTACIAIVFGMTFSIVSTIWAVNDCRARRVDNPIPWALVVFFGGLPGLIIYLIIRPEGKPLAD